MFSLCSSLPVLIHAFLVKKWNKAFSCMLICTASSIPRVVRLWWFGLWWGEMATGCLPTGFTVYCAHSNTEDLHGLKSSSWQPVDAAPTCEPVPGCVLEALPCFFCKLLPLLGLSFPCENGDTQPGQPQMCSDGQHVLFDGSPVLEPAPVLEAATGAGSSPRAPWGGGP